MALELDLDTLDRLSYKALSSIEKINDRIIVAHFNGNPKCTVVVVYSPTNVSKKEDNITLLLGDLNAQISGQWSFHPTSNMNGNKLDELMEEHRLWNGSTSFQKIEGKLWTHLSPKNRRSKIDHVMVSRKLGRTQSRM